MLLVLFAGTTAKPRNFAFTIFVGSVNIDFGVSTTWLFPPLSFLTMLDGRFRRQSSVIVMFSSSSSSNVNSDKEVTPQWGNSSSGWSVTID